VSSETHQIGVSNTEVQQAYACEGKWAFGFHPEYNYQLRNMGVARTRGILGHEALEIFYKEIKDGVRYEEAAGDALSHIQKLRVEELKAGDFADVERLEMLNYLDSILDKYFEHYQQDVENWEILDVEAFFATEQTGESDFYLPSRLDLVIYQKSGKFAGETSPVDHKFTYDFWKRTELILNSQMPLYILALRAARYAGKPKPVVRRAIVNQIRTRPLVKPTMWDLFKREFTPYSSVKIQNIFKNHMKSAVHLAYLKRLPLEEAMEEIRFALGSKSACPYCDFKDLCDATFEGNDPENVIEALY
jgi:hypothetical protein